MHYSCNWQMAVFKICTRPTSEESLYRNTHQWVTLQAYYVTSEYAIWSTKHMSIQIALFDNKIWRRKNMQFGYSCQVLDGNAMPISWIGQQQLGVFKSASICAISMPTVNQLIPGSIHYSLLSLGFSFSFYCMWHQRYAKRLNKDIPQGFPPRTQCKAISLILIQDCSSCVITEKDAIWQIDQERWPRSATNLWVLNA